MVKFDSSIRITVLQFRFSSFSAIPIAAKRLLRKSAKKQQRRGNKPTGFEVIEPTAGCSLLELPGELEEAGYELVDAFCEERVDGNDPRNERTYYVVRFVFARHEFAANISEAFKAARDRIRIALSEICGTSMWRTRSFSNPFYENGKEVDGQRAVSINLDMRTPLFQPDGKPVMVWQKDGKGNRVGVVPIPLVPECELSAYDGILRLYAI